MADIEFRPGQEVPAGRYYVILRPLADVGPGENLGVAAAAAAAPEVPDVNGEMPLPELAPAPAPAPLNMNVNPNENANQSGGKKGKGTKKAKKAKGTRKLSGYMKFAQEVRPRILREDPKLRTDIPGIGRKIGQMWRDLSAAEKARY